MQLDLHNDDDDDDDDDNDDYCFNLQFVKRRSFAQLVVLRRSSSS